MARRKKPSPARDDPRYRRTCTRCGHVRNWRQPCVVKIVRSETAPAIEEPRGSPLPAGIVVGEDWEHWTDFGCPRCGNPEFSVPTYASEDDDAEENRVADGESGWQLRQSRFWDE